MNAPRKKNVVALPESHELSGFGGAVKKHANTALTVLLLAAAVFMFVRWRMNSAAAARQSIATELSNARTMVQELRPTQLPFYVPSEMMKFLAARENDANSAITSVLSSSDADARMRAEALMLRGDLYWELANLPPLPGSTTQPSLQLSESSDSLLQKSWDSYEEVIKNSTYADQHEQLAGSHLGLAAIAENRRDFKTAEAELNLVKNDPKAFDVLQQQATLQLMELPEIQKKIYLAPPSGIAGTLVGPTTQFALPPAISPATQPAMPASMPSLKP